jgi:hypothetical protein
VTEDVKKENPKFEHARIWEIYFLGGGRIWELERLPQWIKPLIPEPSEVVRKFCAIGERI